MDNNQYRRPFNGLFMPVVMLILFVSLFLPLVRGSFSSGQDAYKLEDFREEIGRAHV